MLKISYEDLKGKVCLLTGGTGSIGSALARGLASCGVRIIILERDIANAEMTANEIRSVYKVDAIGIQSDVLSKTSLQKALEEVHAKIGRIDILVNCAGGNDSMATTKVEFMEKDSRLEDTFFGLDFDGFRQTFDLNLLGTVLPTMVFAQDMIASGKGVILNISSMNSFKPLTRIPAYSAAKAAINNFTGWLATHFAKMNIRVNAIAPGFFLTNQNRFLLTDEKSGDLTARGHAITDHTPMGKFGQPEDLCGPCNFLVSDSSAFITGIVLPVDGGFNAFSGV